MLTPWLGKDRVSVQVTATLEDSETRQTVERVRNVVVGGQARPLEKTVRTTRVPEGRIQRVNAIVILGFDASAAELKRAGQLARQALGMLPARGDTPERVCIACGGRRRAGCRPSLLPRRPGRRRPSRFPGCSRSARRRPGPVPSIFSPGCWRRHAAILLLLGAIGWSASPPSPAVIEVPVDDFDAELDAVRSQVLADPRVTADVIKLWMRA